MGKSILVAILLLGLYNVNAQETKKPADVKAGEQQATEHLQKELQQKQLLAQPERLNDTLIVENANKEKAVKNKKVLKSNKKLKRLKREKR